MFALQYMYATATIPVGYVKFNNKNAPPLLVYMALDKTFKEIIARWKQVETKMLILLGII